MVSDLAKQYGAAAQIDISLSDAVDGDTAISEQLQVDGELLEIILRDPNVPLYVGPEVPGYGQQQKNPAEAFCGAGTVLMSITPEGDVTPCNSFPTQFGNLRNNSFREIWDGSEQLNRWQKVVINDYEECGTHERCNYCSRCPGQSFIEHGTPLKASMANCYMANTRMQLAQKLQAGNDPLQGKELGERLLEAEIHQNAVVSSNKESANHRNKSLDLSTMRH